MKRKGLIYAALERLDALMAIGESRHAAKYVLRDNQGPGQAHSTGKIHSYTTRTVYQEHILHFLNWCRAQHGLHTLEEVDARAAELVAAYLQMRLEQHYSPYTLQAERSALRLFFQDAQVGATVRLPQRRRTQITRSRGPVAQDQHFQPANWQPLIRFLQATGLRRSEVRHLRVRDVLEVEEGALWISIRQGKGGKARLVPVLEGQEQAIHAVIGDRPADERIFARLPGRLDIHALRRNYAQALYAQRLSPDQPLPDPQTSTPADYDREAVLYVSRALGHNRLDVVLNHYLR